MDASGSSHPQSPPEQLENSFKAAEELSEGGKYCVTDRRRVKGAKLPANRERRRAKICPCTTERIYTEDDLEFFKAIECYKRKANRQFPTYSEILEVLKSLGYSKTGEISDIPGVGKLV